MVFPSETEVTGQSATLKSRETGECRVLADICLPGTEATRAVYMGNNNNFDKLLKPECW